MLDPTLPRFEGLSAVPYRPPPEKAPAAEHRAHSEMMKKYVKRQCGSCTACCTSHGVTDAEIPMLKPAHVTCSFLCGGGCSIYAKRPAQCAGFECGWKLEPLIAEEMKPEISGWVLDVLMKGPPPIMTVRPVEIEAILLWRCVAVVPGTEPSELVVRTCKALAERDGACALMLGKQTVGSFVDLYLHQVEKPRHLEIVGPCSGAITWMDKHNAERFRMPKDAPADYRAAQIAFAALKLIVGSDLVPHLAAQVSKLVSSGAMKLPEALLTACRGALPEHRNESRLLLASWRLEYADEFASLPESLFD